MTILAQLELNEASEVDFGLEIHGTAEASSEIRFIIEGPQYGIICRCVENNGVITASIPKLKGIIPAGTFDAKLEVVVDGKFFTPLKESIEFKPLVEFDVTSAKAKPVVNTRVETKNIKVRVIEEPKQETVSEAVDELDPVLSPRTQAKREAKPVVKEAPVTYRQPEPVVVPEEDDTPLEEEWAEAITHAVEQPAVVSKKKKTPNPRARELYAKIKALKEQISTVRK